MRNVYRLVVVSAFACVTVFCGGCKKQSPDITPSWTAPAKFAETEDSLGGHVSLYRWRDTVIAWRLQRDRVAKLFVRDYDKQSWSEKQLNGVPLNTWAPLIDESRERLLLKRGYVENEQILLELSFIGLAGGAQMSIDGKVKWTTDKKSLFGNLPANIRLDDGSVGLGDGFVSGSEIHIPYSVDAKTHSGKAVFRTHFNNGVFYSADSGKTWQIDPISNFESGAPTTCRTREYLYYFALRDPLPQYGLWFSRRAIEGGSWESPEMITKTFGNAYGRYVAVSTDDTVHVCWLDGRHEQTRLGIDPYRKNYEVAYCRRKDSGSGWSKEILLSKGLLYTYWPTMSVDGDRIVIAWAGVKAAKDGHGEYAPNDVYYVTSKDGGKTWTKPLKVTDGAKDGITSGRPQVVLLNGVIHLLYVEGKLNLKEESPGLTKLNQPPWPIYYQQRPFPN